MKRLFILLSILIGIAGIIFQFWIAYVFFYDPGYEDQTLYNIKVYECKINPKDIQGGLA